MKIIRGTIYEMILYGLFLAAWTVPETYYMNVGVVVRPLDVAAALLVGIVLLSQLGRGKVWFFGDRSAALLAGLIVWGGVSILWAEHRGAVLPQVVQWFELFLIFAFLTTFLRAEDHLRQFVLVFLVFASAVQLIQGFQSVPVVAQLVSYERERPDPFFSGVLIVYLCAAWVEGERPFPRYAMAGLILLSSINMIYSLTRKGIIGCVASLALLLVLSSASPGRLLRRIAVLAGIGAGLLLVVHAGVPELSGDLERRFKVLALQDQNPGGGVEGRLTHVAISYNILKEHPWVGIGLGNHHLRYKEFFTQVFEGRGPQRTAGAHSGFLLVVSELGLIGIFVLFLLFVRPLKMMNLYRYYGHRLANSWILLGSVSLFPLIVLKFGTAHAGIGRMFPLIFLLVLTNAYQRLLNTPENSKTVSLQREGTPA